METLSIVLLALQSCRDPAVNRSWHWLALQDTASSLMPDARMAADVHNKGVSWEVKNGNLAPSDRLRQDRSDSPTPGLVEGTEPG